MAADAVLRWEQQMGHRVENQFAAVPESVHAARTFVRIALGVWGAADVVEPAALLTSEIVTNAILHAGTEYGVAIEFDGSDLLIEVADGSADTPVRIEPAALAVRGRGLVLVDGLAERWGAQLEGSHKKVWFRLRSTSADTAA